MQIYGRADATIRTLHAKQGAYGGGNVCDVGLTGSAATGNIPAIEYQWGVGIVRTPRAVGCTFVVGIWLEAIIPRLEDNLYVAAALWVVAVCDAPAYGLRNV